MVQNGQFAACAAAVSVSALNSVDLPTLGNPTIPHLNPIVLLDPSRYIAARNYLGSSYAGLMTRVSIFFERMDRRIKSGDDEHYFSSSSDFSINPLACIARCTLFLTVESLSVTSSPALSAIASQSASTQGRSLWAKSDSTWPCTSSLPRGWPTPSRTRR